MGGDGRDSDGNFYLIGAHNGKTDEERNTKSVLIRFRLKDGDLPTIDDASIITWHVARSLEAALKAEGMPPEQVAKRKVEGLSIREHKTDWRTGPSRALYRPPRTQGQDPRLHGRYERRRPRPTPSSSSSPPSHSPPTREKVKPQSSRLSNMCRNWPVSWSSPRRRTLRTPSMETPCGLSPTAKRPGHRRSPSFEVAMKAEGLAILGAEKNGPRTAVNLLIAYDNDAHATHIPSRIQRATLVRETR